jgi:hypothetical protein
MVQVEQPFSGIDDGLHDPSANFYETETFWFSFFVPERALGGWLYTSVRQTAGVSGGGLWIWDATAVDPWAIPFYEQFSALKLPDERGGEKLSFPNGMQVIQREPLMAYDLNYEDRKRVSVALHFDAVEPPVPLVSGTPPYPKAHHFDQTGRVTGRITLDGERIDVDCYAMRDRSWGPRNERGYRRVGYCWAANGDTSFLTYSAPTDDSDDIYAGYLRRDGEIAHLVSGRRRVERDPARNWITAISLDATDTLGRELHAEARATSRMVLPNAASICICTALPWTIGGHTVHGEDQDVWPISEWRQTLTH